MTTNPDRSPRADYMAAYYVANGDRIRAYSKAWKARHRREIRLRRKGLTVEQYDAMVATQGGRCAICGRIPPYELVPDHDHSCCPTELSCGWCIRGLLCHGCNAGIGYLGDTAEAVERATEYLFEARRRRATWTEEIVA